MTIVVYRMVTLLVPVVLQDDLVVGLMEGRRWTWTEKMESG
jgi:hypothetical protein